MAPMTPKPSEATRERERLRQRVHHLEQEGELRREVDQERQFLRERLSERERELDCLYGFSRLIEEHGTDLDRILSGLVALLPPAWEHPESTAVRLTVGDRVFSSRGFAVSRWCLTVPVVVGGEEVGRLDVYYTQPPLPPGSDRDSQRDPDGHPDSDPFSQHERLLIEAVAERLGRATERIWAQQQLEIERMSLRNTNIALREVLAKLKEEKMEIGRAVHANVTKLVLPHLLALEPEIQPRIRTHLRLIKQHLEEITAPFARQLANEFLGLTITELQICEMIRRGLTSKEIARVRGVSPATVSRQREHIRAKLGLTNRSVNLATFLRTYAKELQVTDE